MNLLSLLLRRVTTPGSPRKPESDWEWMGCQSECRFTHTLTRGRCAYAPEPFSVDEPDPLLEVEELMASIVDESESDGFALGRLAELTAGGLAPWDAASSVFGGAGVTRGTAWAGLCGPVAGEPAESVHG
ncbi:hypothetical protein [Sphaerisporangium sp. TRM90804]|uniref:hypothetical protein n=1 Tax=Sphaerisporangium sp. TRM90804 TaxID=3031113 RepID=UPI00244751EB|nr:hypothetical protein [Sphaerisporangium sp. TRM90804]MDH2424804.1 hypothetical protein [Sphaerisporangium sp. TRM90804]